MTLYGVKESCCACILKPDLLNNVKKKKCGNSEKKYGKIGKVYIWKKKRGIRIKTRPKDLAKIREKRID